MSTRPQIRPQIVIPSPQGSPANGNSMATNITSAPTVIDNLTAASYAYSWTGTSPVGTISVQCSNDYALNPDSSVKNAGTWTTLTLNYQGSAVQSIPLTGNSGNGFIDLSPLGGYAIRTVYTATSGTGSLIVNFVSKVF